MITEPVTFQQMLDQGDMTRSIYFGRGSICYIPYRGRRHFIDLGIGSFDDYLKKFSKKARYNLVRTVRQFAKESGGSIDARCYRLSEEIEEFCRHAVFVSRLTYQHKLGLGFPEIEEFRNKLIEDVQNAKVIGYILMLKHQPVSYALCRINFDIITYSLIGYDPKFTKLSPGKVLLYIILKKAFEERRFRLFDFGGQDWDYKAHHATGSIGYLRVIWFPRTAKNVILVTAHYVLLQTWRAAAEIKRLAFSKTSSARALIGFRSR